MQLMGLKYERALKAIQLLPELDEVRFGRYVVSVDRERLEFGTVSPDDYYAERYGKEYQQRHTI